MRWLAIGIGVAAVIAAVLAVARMATRETTRPAPRAAQAEGGATPERTAGEMPGSGAVTDGTPRTTKPTTPVVAPTGSGPFTQPPSTIARPVPDSRDLAGLAQSVNGEAPVRAPGTDENASATAPSTRPPAEPPGTGRIFGRVLDKDGLGARDVLVYIRRDGSRGLFELDERIYRKLDGKGGFSAEHLAEGTYTVACLVKKLPVLMRRVALAIGEEKEVDFSFASGVRLYGTVRRGGRAVADTQLAFGPEQGADVTTILARTNDSGAYEVRGVQPGLLRLSIGALVVRFQIPAGTDELREDIDLPVGTISGRVYDGKTRAPLPRTNVEAYHAADPGLDSGQIASRFAGTAQTDDEGRFTIAGLAGGAYRVQASRKGFLPEARQAVELPEGGGADAVDLYLVAGAELRGTILDDQGRPLEGASLTIRDARTREPLLGQGTAEQSDAKGAITIEGVTIGDVLVTGHAAGFAKETRTVTVTEAGVSVDFRLSAEARVRVTVRDKAGAPVEHAVLVLHDAQGVPVDPGPTEFDDVKTSQSGTDGVVSRGGLAPGSYRGEAASAKGRGYFEFDVMPGQTADVAVTVEEGK